MPQGRRKQPFSGKAKKLQLQAKKQRKGTNPTLLTKNQGDADDHDEEPQVFQVNVPQPCSSKAKSARYALQFYRESEDEIIKRKREAREELTLMQSHCLEVRTEDYFTPEHDFPVRPPWRYYLSRQELDRQEHSYFSDYVKKLDENFHNELSYFELNLETWRQLWRVLEISDIVLVIVDIRFPAAMFPPSLYSFITGTLKKDMIVVLNKVDLAPPPLVAAWKNYFKEQYPLLYVLMFTSFPTYNLRGKMEKTSGLKVCRQRGKLKMAAEGAQKLYEVCKEITKDKVDLSSWLSKIKEEMEDESECDQPDIEKTLDVKVVDTSYVNREQFSDGILSIGCIGHPNVGKSSLLNAIMGKKVVSVSRTPGHTKHFQTIFLTPHVKLVDCPGLVFPSKVPRTLQVLMGSYPIAQLREPYSAVKFLAERLELPRMLSLHTVLDTPYSAWDICEAWARKKGYYTARVAREDTYRAANHILRMSLEGKICLCLYPPNFSAKKDYWENHEDAKTVKWIQAREVGKPSDKPKESDSSEDDDDYDEYDEKNLPSSEANSKRYEGDVSSSDSIEKDDTGDDENDDSKDDHAEKCGFDDNTTHDNDGTKENTSDNAQENKCSGANDNIKKKDDTDSDDDSDDDVDTRLLAQNNKFSVLNEED